MIGAHITLSGWALVPSAMPSRSKGDDLVFDRTHPLLLGGVDPERAALWSRKPTLV